MTIVIYNISADIAEFLANFLRRIVKKMGQKLILGHNFINNISDDFYVLQLCFFNILLLDHQKLQKTSILVEFFFAIFGYF